jgi:hypothetical protein
MRVGTEFKIPGSDLHNGSSKNATSITDADIYPQMPRKSRKIEASAICSHLKGDSTREKDPS